MPHIHSGFAELSRAHAAQKQSSFMRMTGERKPASAAWTAVRDALAAGDLAAAQKAVDESGAPAFNVIDELPEGEAALIEQAAVRFDAASTNWLLERGASLERPDKGLGALFALSKADWGESESRRATGAWIAKALESCGDSGVGEGSGFLPSACGFEAIARGNAAFLAAMTETASTERQMCAFFMVLGWPLPPGVDGWIEQTRAAVRYGLREEPWPNAKDGEEAAELRGKVFGLAFGDGEISETCAGFVLECADWRDPVRGAEIADAVARGLTQASERLLAKEAARPDLSERWRALNIAPETLDAAAALLAERAERARRVNAMGGRAEQTPLEHAAAWLEGLRLAESASAGVRSLAERRMAGKQEQGPESDATAGARPGRRL
jgi:hypothetical protein